MRIVSLNAWCGTMWDQLAAWLPTCGADVLCVQEVTRCPGLRGWVAFDDGEHAQPQRADLLRDMAALLPEHQASFVVHDAGPVDLDGTTRRQDFGMALFVADHLPVVGGATAYVNGDFIDHVDAWPISDRPRLAQAIRVVDRTGGRAVTVAHTHGLRDAAGKGDTPARVAQAEALGDLVRLVGGPDDLVIVAGDLNVLPGSRTFAILGRMGLKDLVGDADTRTSRYTKPVRHADYMLVSDPSQVKGFTVQPEPEVSDHRPLVLDL